MHKAKGNMTKVDTFNGYDFYIGSHVMNGGFTAIIYNIVPADSPAPVGGYKNMRYIEGVKGVLFPDRYQPTKHGMSHSHFDANGKD